MNGRITHLVSFVSGEVRSVQHLDEIRAMKSVEAVEVSVGVGSAIQPTVDISATDCGTIRLLHQDEDVIRTDFARIVELMRTMFVVD